MIFVATSRLLLIVLSLFGSVWSEPEQIHLSQGYSSDTMTVDWLDWTPEISPTANYYTEAGNLVKSFPATENMWKSEGNLTRYLYRAVLTGLEPGRHYYYQVGSPKNYCTRKEGTQWFAPIATRSTSFHPLRLAIYGDFGVINDQSETLLTRTVQSGGVDMILHAGDIAYNLHYHDGKTGDQFMQQIEPLATRVPYMVAPGNHEEYQNFSHYQHRFSMPGAESGSNTVLYSSFNVGLFHIVSLSTELYFYPNYYNNTLLQQQYDWLQKDLARANQERQIRPWILVFGHRPIYCTLDRNDEAGICTLDTSKIRDGVSYTYGEERVGPLERLFHEQKVDFYFAGHMHSYERMWPVYREQTLANNYHNPESPVYLIGGSPGCQEQLDRFDYTPYPWSAFRADAYGFGIMTVYNETDIQWQQIHAENGTVLDEIWVHQDR
jgi:acid phosphatase type 7